jgi:5-methylcytosine-specific restriction endonuclease McrA
MRANGWCVAHNSRVDRYGDVRADVPLRPRRASAAPGACEVETCERSRFALGLCRTHYQRAKSARGVQPERPISQQIGSPDGFCIIKDCTRTLRSGRYCSTHQSRIYRTGSADKRVITPEILAERAEALRSYQRKYKLAEYQVHHGRILANHRAWVVKNSERVKLWDAAKRHRRRASRSVEFSVDNLALKWRYWSGLCWLCGGEATAWDHVKPLSKGGWHMLSNLRPCCRSCNSRKGARWPYAPQAAAA